MAKNFCNILSISFKWKRRIKLNSRIEKDQLRLEVVGLKEKLKDVEIELNNIKTVNYVCSKPFFLEKIFWAVLGIIGIAWAFYFIPGNIQLWRDNPSIKMQGEMKLSQLKYPAISLFQPGTTKYVIAETLGNYLDPQNLPLELRQLRNLMLKCAILYKDGYAKKYSLFGGEIPDSSYFNDYQENCLIGQRYSKKIACKVRYQF